MDNVEQDLEQRVRKHAYFLWQQEGCPDGQADRHWRRACELEAERDATETRIDIEEEDSFPASDPPSRSVIIRVA